MSVHDDETPTNGGSGPSAPETEALTYAKAAVVTAQRAVNNMFLLQEGQGRIMAEVSALTTSIDEARKENAGFRGETRASFLKIGTKVDRLERERAGMRKKLDSIRDPAEDTGSHDIRDLTGAQIEISRLREGRDEAREQIKEMTRETKAAAEKAVAEAKAATALAEARDHEAKTWFQRWWLGIVAAVLGAVVIVIATHIITKMLVHSPPPTAPAAATPAESAGH